MVIVNAALASRVWPGEDPIGRRLKWGTAASQNPWLTVVGVVADVPHTVVGDVVGPQVYEPFRQFSDLALERSVIGFGRDVRIALRTDGEPRALAAMVRREIAGREATAKGR